MGISFWDIQAGFQLSYAQLGQSLNGSLSDLGFYLGYTFLESYRIYGAYSFNSILNTSVPVNLRLQGDGSHIGVGYNLWLNLFVNLEYATRTFRSGSVGSASVSEFEIPLTSIRASVSAIF